MLNQSDDTLGLLLSRTTVKAIVRSNKSGLFTVSFVKPVGLQLERKKIYYKNMRSHRIRTTRTIRRENTRTAFGYDCWGLKGRRDAWEIVRGSWPILWNNLCHSIRLSLLRMARDFHYLRKVR